MNKQKDILAKTEYEVKSDTTEKLARLYDMLLNEEMHVSDAKQGLDTR